MNSIRMFLLIFLFCNAIVMASVPIMGIIIFAGMKMNKTLPNLKYVYWGGVDGLGNYLSLMYAVLLIAYPFGAQFGNFPLSWELAAYWVVLLIPVTFGARVFKHMIENLVIAPLVRKLIERFGLKPAQTFDIPVESLSKEN